MTPSPWALLRAGPSQEACAQPLTRSRPAARSESGPGHSDCAVSVSQRLGEPSAVSVGCVLAVEPGPGPRHQLLACLRGRGSFPRAGGSGGGRPSPGHLLVGAGAHRLISRRSLAGGASLWAREQPSRDVSARFSGAPRCPGATPGLTLQNHSQRCWGATGCHAPPRRPVAPAPEVVLLGASHPSASWSWFCHSC